MPISVIFVDQKSDYFWFFRTRVKRIESDKVKTDITLRLADMQCVKNRIWLQANDFRSHRK